MKFMTAVLMSIAKTQIFSIFATVNDKQAELYLDLSGTSLHRRGYRVAMTEAPLKENLAAALLYSSGWHKKNDAGNAPFYNALMTLCVALVHSLSKRY